MDRAFYVENRGKLAARMMGEDVMLFFSGELVRKSADESFPFFANSNFLYLTGVSQERSALLLLKRNDLVSECLFVTKPDFEREIWSGNRLTEEELHELSGVEAVENMVFTLDAGIYVREWGIGLRIEDNVRVTADGCENLSAAIPATLEEIESFIAGKREAG